MDTTAIVLLLVSALVLAVITAAILRAVRRDGLGHGTPPRSHHEWDAR